LTYGRPEPAIEAVAGAPALKTATLTVTVDYESDAPLSQNVSTRISNAATPSCSTRYIPLSMRSTTVSPFKGLDCPTTSTERSEKRQHCRGQLPPVFGFVQGKRSEVPPSKQQDQGNHQHDARESTPEPPPQNPRSLQMVACPGAILGWEPALSELGEQRRADKEANAEKDNFHHRAAHPLAIGSRVERTSLTSHPPQASA
jgi:hypothetical protein